MYLDVGAETERARDLKLRRLHERLDGLQAAGRRFEGPSTVRELVRLDPAFADLLGTVRRAIDLAGILSPRNWSF